jgi:chitinase
MLITLLGWENRLANRLTLAGIAFLISLASLTQAVGRTAGHPASSYKVVGYYLDRGDAMSAYVLEHMRADKLTHLNYAFAAIRNGEVVLDEHVEAQKIKTGFAMLATLKHRNRHLKTLISIGGWGGSQEFSNVALTPEARAKFADSAVAFVRKYGFDGVDIDWEFPVGGGDDANVHRPEDKQNYTLLFQALREKLDLAGKKDKHAYLLTVALGNNEEFLANTEMDKVARIVDWANLMTYDFNGHWNNYAGHVAPLYDDPTLKHVGNSPKYNVSATVDMTVQAGVPAGKLVLGVPFYGYSWKQCGASNHGQLQDCRGKGRGSLEDGTLVFTDIDNLVNKKGFVRYWNDNAKAPYLFNTDTGEFVSYEDVESLENKIKYLKTRGLAGAMFWELTGDRNFVLQNKLARDLLGK